MKRVIGKRPSMVTQIPVMYTEKKNSLTESFADIEQVLSAASNRDAIAIFYEARNGIESSTKAIKELDLTPKRYYTNLKRLMDVNLVEKTDGAYRHTTLGRICLRLMDIFQNALNQRDRLDLVDRLGKAKNITLEETEEIMRAILKDANVAPSERIEDFLGPVRMADTWEKVVHDVVECLDRCKESVYFASQYLDTGTIEALFRAAQRGVKMNFLMSQEDRISDALKLLVRSVFTHPKHLRFLVQILSSPELRIRCVDLPYTFFVVDRKIAMVEVVKPFTKAFSLAFFFQNERLCERLIESFETLWAKGTDVKTLVDRLGNEST